MAGIDRPGARVDIQIEAAHPPRCKGDLQPRFARSKLSVRLHELRDVVRDCENMFAATLTPVLGHQGRRVVPMSVPAILELESFGLFCAESPEDVLSPLLRRRWIERELTLH